jgi:hypothetical protein
MDNHQLPESNFFSEVEIVDSLQYLNVYGVEVPWRPSVSTTVLTKVGPEIRLGKPQYVVNLEKFLETESLYALSAGLLSLKREVLLTMVSSMAFRSHGFEAPIAVSAGVPYGHVYIDKVGGRIILNEYEAANRAVDADGDRGIIIAGDSKDEAVLVKFPITSQPPILKMMEVPPVEVFHSFTSKDVKKLQKSHPVVAMDERGFFDKKHMDVPVGLLTTAHNVLDLWESKDMSYEDKMEHIYNSNLDENGLTLRYREIELGAMKAARKDNKGLSSSFEVLLRNKCADVAVGYGNQRKLVGASRALSDEYAPLMTSLGSISRLGAEALSFLTQPGCNLDKLAQDVFSLEPTFREVKAKDRPEAIEKFVENGLLSRLIALGLVQYQEIPHTDSSLPPAVMIWLQSPGGEVVGLTDVKRQGRSEGLTYVYLLSPVYDNSTLHEQDGMNVAIPAQGWMHPIDFLGKMLMSFDSEIRPYANGPITHYFPKNREDWVNPKRSVKVAMLLSRIQELCGIYGDAAGAEMVDGAVKVFSHAKAIATRSVVIDYGKPCSEWEMYPIARRANANGNICIVGSKSTDRRVRKYMLANQGGGSVLDKSCLAHPYRAACNRSQLFRALETVKMTVAFVKMDTQSQILITSTGIKKQETTKAFLPRVFNTFDEYEAHLKGHGLTEEQCPAKEVVYESWTGEKRICWTIDGKNAIKIGKLVDAYGNKFMPRWYEQVHAIDYTTMDSLDVDLIFPITELVDKGAHHVLLQKGKMEDRDLVLPDGTTVPCVVVQDVQFFRTGSASENIPPRMRSCKFKGMDSFPIYWQVSKIKSVPPRTADLNLAKEMQTAVRKLERKFGLS